MPKTVIEIDVLDDKFKAFVEAFKKFQSAVEEAEGKISDLGDKSEEAGNKGNKAFGSFRKTLDDFKRSADSAFPTISKFGLAVADIAKSAASAAFSFSKWLAFGAIGSGFGLGALASSAVSTQNQASGYGISSGALRAARTSFSPLGVDVEKILSAITRTRLDPTAGAAYNLFGIQGQATEDPMQTFFKLIKGAKGLNKGSLSNPAIVGMAETLGLSMEQINTIQGKSEQELQQATQATIAKTPRYETSEKGWTNFLTALEDAGEIIETSLIRNLNKLTPELGKLATAIADAIDKGLTSGSFQEFVTGVGAQIKRLYTYLKSPQFFEAMETFWYAIMDLGIEIQKVANWIAHPIDSTKAALTANPFALTKGQEEIVGKYASGQFKGLPEGMLKNLVAVKNYTDPSSFNTLTETRDQVQKLGITLQRAMDYYGHKGISPSSQQTLAYLAAFDPMGTAAVDKMVASNKGNISNDPTAKWAAHYAQKAGGYNLNINFTSDVAGSAAAQVQSLGSEHDAYNLFQQQTGMGGQANPFNR